MLVLAGCQVILYPRQVVFCALWSYQTGVVSLKCGCTVKRNFLQGRERGANMNGAVTLLIRYNHKGLKGQQALLGETIHVGEQAEGR